MNWRSAIAARRHDPILKLVASMCGKFLRAYDNQFNWDITTNGERYIVTAVSAKVPGIVFDVGANVGTYAKMCATLPGVSEVHAFEISPPTFEILSQNCAAVMNVRLNPFGLGASAGSVIVYHAPDSTDRTGLLPIEDGYARQALAAELRTGDDYMHNVGIDRIALLKIDVEGSDIEVLRGFSSALAAKRIAAVQFEHGEASIETRTFLRDIVQYLQSYGYGTYRLYPNSLERMDHCTYALEDFRGRNYVALLPEMATKLGL